MTTPTHDPLTDKHKAILARAPFEMTIAEMNASGEQLAVSFLRKLGYLHGEQTHIGAEPGNSRYRFERTAKPID